MSILEMCNKSSVSAYNSELERQKSLNAKTDLLFRWLTLLITVFNFLISLISGFDIDTSGGKKLFNVYVAMMFFFLLSFFALLYINFPTKQKIPSLGSERLRRIQNKLKQDTKEDDCVYREILYEEILENDVITKALRSHNQRIAVVIMIAEIFMALGLVSATVILGCSMWKG